MRRCPECLDDVSERCGVVGTDGALRHDRCAQQPSPEEVLLRRIFGESNGPSQRRREFVATRDMATATGHAVHFEKVRHVGRKAVCTCGWESSWLRGAEQARARDVHLKDAAIYADRRMGSAP